MNKIRWTEKEIKVLKTHYPLLGRKISRDEFFTLLPNRTAYSVRHKVKRLGIKAVYHRPSYGNLSKLLQETPEAYYWAGFIAADGHIKNNIQLQLYLSFKDKAHIEKLLTFLNYSKQLCVYNKFYKSIGRRYKTVGFQFTDKLLMPKFAKKFDLKHNKTYNPPNLNWLEGDKFLAFFAGFIDGDGHIHKNSDSNSSVLAITSHKNWFLVLKLFEQKLYWALKIPKLTHNKYIGFRKNVVVWQLSRKIVLRTLKSKLLKMNLPLLNRKWNQIEYN